MIKDTNTRIIITISKELADKIKNDCSKECTTKSKKIESILEEYYEQKK